MKSFGTIVTFFLLQVMISQSLMAHTITVHNVKASAKGNSTASAQQQALDQAYQLAFQKLVTENFPDYEVSSPPLEALRGMVKDFSVNQEKTTPTSYMAILTFQFDEPLVSTWLQRMQHGKSSLPLTHQSETLNLTASYTTHKEWQHIRETLENFPGVQTLSIFTLSPKNANIRITYKGTIDTLKTDLTQKGILLTQQEDGWVVSASGSALR